MSDHIAKYGFMPNYLVWHQHGEVQALAPAESDGRYDEDWIDDMIANIGMEYDLGSGDLHPRLEVQNFYSLRWESARWHWFDHTAGFDASYGDEIDVQLLKSVLQQYHEVDYWSHPSEALHAKRLIRVQEDYVLSQNELQEDWWLQKKFAHCFGRSTKMTLNVCIAVGPDTWKW
jgi:hypothetical protein